MRSAIRALREAAQTARDQSTMFQLGCAEKDEKNEAQLREALANLGTDPDEGTAVHVTSHPDAGWSSSATELQHGGSWNAKAPLRSRLRGAASHERQQACYATRPGIELRPSE